MLSIVSNVLDALFTIEKMCWLPDPTAVNVAAVPASALAVEIATLNLP